MTASIKLTAMTLPLFVAESNYQGVKSSAIGELLVQAAALAVIVMVIWNFVDRVRFGSAQRREIQQPLTVQKQRETVSEEELRQVHGRIARERAEIDAQLTDLKAEDVRLREKLDSDIADLHDRINSVPDRTIKLLRETKGLI